jgi:hypothetical protein
MFRRTDKVIAAMEQQLGQRQKKLSREQIPLFSLALSSIFPVRMINWLNVDYASPSALI